MSSVSPGYRIKYSTLSIGAEDFHLCSLRDRQQFADHDGLAERAGISSATWPLFGQLWPAGEVLAQTLSGMAVQGLRILELGCGLGLTSLLLQRLGADITASDHHPLAGEFLLRNAALNELQPITYLNCDWAAYYRELGLFDLIIGSDLLYERDHPALLALLALVASRRLLVDRRPAISESDDPRQYSLEMEVEPGSALVGGTILSLASIATWFRPIVRK